MFIRSHLPQSKLLLGTREGGHILTHAPSTKKLQQLSLKRLKHLIRLRCEMVQAKLQAYRSECVYVCGRRKVESQIHTRKTTSLVNSSPSPSQVSVNTGFSSWSLREVHVGEAATVCLMRPLSVRKKHIISLRSNPFQHFGSMLNSYKFTCIYTAKTSVILAKYFATTIVCDYPSLHKLM